RGMTASPLHLLVLLGVLLAVNFVVCTFSGFRHETSFKAAAAEAVTAMGVGLILSAAVLMLIGEVQLDSALAPAVAKILITATPVSLGVSFANTHIRGSGRADDDSSEGKSQDADDEPTPGKMVLSATSRQVRQDLMEMGASLSGASLFAFNVAPTEEVLVIGARLSAWQHLLVMAASLGLCYIIIFAAGFKERRVHVPSLFQHPWTETLLAYAVSLAVSMGMLWLVGLPETMDDLSI